MNRQLTGVIADLHFAPTKKSAENLLTESKARDNIFITANTAIDALKTTIQEDYNHKVLELLNNDRMVLLTANRRENLGKPMKNVFKVVKRLVMNHNDIQVVYPVHLNPVVKDFHNFASRPYLILTDSGGIQEEAPSLGKPVLVNRDTTERPEGIAAGTSLNYNYYIKGDIITYS